MRAIHLSFLMHQNMPQHGNLHTREDPNQAPTEVAPSTHATREGEAPSIPDTPHFNPDQGDPSPEEPAVGIATRIAAKERMTQTPPLLFRLGWFRAILIT